jgi:Spy/CpxP family protein refolding chaperone
MKMNKLSLIAALVLGGLVAGGTTATAQEAKEGKDAKGGKRGFPSVQERLERMTEHLKLTDAQKPKVKAVLEEQDKQMQGMRDVPQEERRTKGREIREATAKKMKEILTPEQFEKYEQMPRPGRPGGAGGGKKGEEKKKD